VVRVGRCFCTLLPWAPIGSLTPLRVIFKRCSSHFEPGKTVYAQLIAKPLSAIATIDCGTSRFRTVRFLNRP
jgi:hypothetical protein